MQEEKQFLRNLYRFARWVTFFTGSCGAIALIISFLHQNYITASLYLVGTVILYSVSTFFMIKQRGLEDK